MLYCFFSILKASSITLDGSNTYTEIQTKQAHMSTSSVSEEDVAKSKDEILKELSYYKNFIYSVKWIVSVACVVGATLYVSSEKILKILKARQAGELTLEEKEISESAKPTDVYDIIKNKDLIEKPPHYDNCEAAI